MGLGVYAMQSSILLCQRPQKPEVEKHELNNIIRYDHGHDSKEPQPVSRRVAGLCYHREHVNTRLSRLLIASRG